MNIYYAVLKEFKTKWEKRYSGRVFTPRPYHYKQVKELLTPVEGFEPLELSEICTRIDIYLRSKFYEVCAHNISIFIKNFDSFIPPAPRRVPDVVACQKCGEIHRINEQHKCGIIGDGLRKDKHAVDLNSLLPQRGER